MILAVYKKGTAVPSSVLGPAHHRAKSPVVTPPHTADLKSNGQPARTIPEENSRGFGRDAYHPGARFHHRTDSNRKYQRARRARPDQKALVANRFRGD